jgi:hypothetical protein
MKSFRLPILAVLAVAVLLAVSPIALSAQAPAVSPTLLAAAEAPVTFSSSVVPDADATAPVATESYSAAAASAAPAPATTETSTRPFSALGVGVKIGLGGIGFDVATPLAKRFNIRGGAGFLSYNASETVNNQTVNANLKLNNAEVMLDWFPFNGSFRLAAGMTIYNNTGVTGSTTVAGGKTITIGGTSYTSDPSAPITPNVSAKFGGNAVPRFTLGWGNLAKRTGHWSFDTEFGIEITGTPTVGWTYGGQGCTGSANTGFRPGVAATTCYTGYGPVGTTDITNQNASLQSDFNAYKIFPIFSIGIGYKIGH